MFETTKTPDDSLAVRLATKTTGVSATGIKRFQTGSSHYVFEVSFADRAPVVVRLSTVQNLTAMQGASKLSHQLRPLGVPLPEIIAEELTPPFPYIILERLPGTDLGDVYLSLTPHQLEEIVKEVVRVQGIVATTNSSGRYGYAVNSDDAPFRSWSEIIEASLNRSSSRIKAANLFDLAVVEQVRELFVHLRAELDAQPSIPFLHDTTTKNVIVTPDGTLSGVVDVDDLCFGDPRYVTALTQAALLAYYDGQTHYTDAWLKIAGFDNDRLYRFYVALFLVDLMAEHGQSFNGNEKPSDPQQRQALLRAYDEMVQVNKDGKV